MECFISVNGIPQNTVSDVIKNFIKMVGNPEVMTPTVYLAPEILEYEGVAAAQDIKIRYTNYTTEDNAKVYQLNKPIADSFIELFIPFGRIAPELGRKLINETTLGKIIHENDPYMEELGTLWILHYRLATNFYEATAWYYFFNEFKPTEFTRDDFVTQVNSYLRIQGEEVSERSVEDDYNCIISTYVSRIKSNPEKVQPESNIDCPLGELGLIDIVNVE